MTDHLFTRTPWPHQRKGRKRDMTHRVSAKTLAFEEIRRFLVRRKFLRGNIVDEETFDLIYDRQIKLSDTMRRELSVFIDGYLRAKT